MKNNQHSGFIPLYLEDEGDCTDLCLVFMLGPGQAKDL